jgi:hypothetical protein
MKKAVLGGVMAVAALLAFASPSLRRYLKIEKM